MRLCSQRAYARRGHDLRLRGVLVSCGRSIRCAGTAAPKICWSIAHVFQKLTGVAEGVEPLPDRFLVDAPSEGADKLADLATKIEGGNYSVYICYIVAALVVFLVLAVLMGLERGEDIMNIVLAVLQGRGRHAGRAVLLRSRPRDSREDAQSSRSVHHSGLPRPGQALCAPRVPRVRLRVSCCASCRRCSSPSPLCSRWACPCSRGAKPHPGLR